MHGDTSTTERLDVNFVDDYLFLTLAIREKSENVQGLQIAVKDGYIVASKAGSFPTVAVQSRNSNLTIYEFGARTIPYTVEAV